MILEITKFHSGILLASLLVACSGEHGTARDTTIGHEQAAAHDRTIDPETWTSQEAVFIRDAAFEQQIASLLDTMTVQEKVGQIIQADINSVTPDEVREYNLGSILNGGGSAPGGDNRTSADQWLALADEFWDASTDTSDGGVGIPAIWGTDAVHGHNNIVGATIFPHNIGLGMADDPEIAYQVGQVTAREMLATGLDWTFAPTVAVARNDRWGRTYESYSEDPRIVAAYAPRIVEGIQGVLGGEEFLDENHMIATAKHFAGDGGTGDGRDQGDTISTEEELQNIHAAGYPPAIKAGVQTVMASYSSFHGRKMHGHKEMLTDVLVGRMAFDGFVVGDWNGHGQVETCTNISCPESLNAGLDMFMAPDSWKLLYTTTLQQVQSGEISMARLDEAVSRILRVKLRAGVFAAGRPSTRRHAGEFSLLGSDKHRAIARDAVRKSLIMLKNEDRILPLSPHLNILLAGDGAHNIGKQSGGWTLSWQGTGNLNEHFPNGMSIYEGFRDAFQNGDGSVTLSEDGSYSDTPDVAIVVFGENPYAEFQGDRATVDYASDDGLELLEKFREAGIPTVSVFLSGRALWVNPEINRSSAFVAAWLPGTEGGGIADVLVAEKGGNARFDFEGKLSFSWPKTADQVALNVGDDNYAPLFPYGYQLTYSGIGNLAQLSEESSVDDNATIYAGNLMAYGDPVGNWSLMLRDNAGANRIGDSRGGSAAGIVRVEPADRNIQEDTIIVTWSDAGTLAIVGRGVDFVRETNGDMALELTYQVIDVAAESIAVEMARGFDQRSAIDVSAAIKARAGSGWHTALIKLSCFEDQGLDMASISAPLVISADGPMTLQIESAQIVGNPGNAGCAL